MASIIDRALVAHAQIKRKLVDSILDPAGADPEWVRSDRLCQFGQWIYGPEGSRYCGRPAFQALKATHRRFHEAAFAALCDCRAGQRDRAVASIETGDFATLSEDMKVRLLAVRDALR